METELRAVILATNCSLDELRDSHELLKKNYSLVVGKLDAAEMRAQEAEANCEKLQSECRAMYEDWNSQLLAQAEEFRSLEAQMVPKHQVHLAKLELTENLRRQNAYEMDCLRLEIENKDNSLNQAKRNLQTVKAQFDDLMDQQENAKHRYEKVVNNLKTSITEKDQNIQICEQHCSKFLEQVRVLELNTTEQTVIEMHLRSELESAIGDADKAILKKSELEVRHARSIKEVEMRTSELLAQLEGATNRSSEAIAVRDQVLEQLKGSEIDNKKLRSQIASMHRGSQEERAQWDSQTRAMEQKFVQEKHQWNSLREHLERELEVYQNRIDSYQRNQELSEAEFKRHEQQLLESSSSEIEQVQSLLSASRLKCSELEATINRMNDDAVSVKAIGEQQELSMVREICELKFSLDAKVNELTLQSEALKKALSDLTLSRQSLEALTVKHETQLTSAKEAKLHFDEILDQHKKAHSQLERLQTKLNILENDMARDTQDWTIERESMLKQIRSEDEQIATLRSHIQSLESDASRTQLTLESNIQKLKKDRQRQKQTTKELRDRMTKLIREIAGVKQMGHYDQQGYMWAPDDKIDQDYEIEPSRLKHKLNDAHNSTIPDPAVVL
uniref:Uncharacterized protein n=1 Tax=Spongospora subterranea TaxID=70186 RepID=A0A0H5RMD7_9EUKA|eukprot:CRZ09884.1 hypothetical protein [Spongospora subterranea]